MTSGNPRWPWVLVYQSGVQFALLYFSYLNTSGVLDHPLTTDSTTPDSTISILHFGQLQTMVLLITWVLEYNLYNTIYISRQYISFGLLLNHFTFITFIGFGISFVAFISIDLIYNAMPDVCPTLEYWSLQNMSYQILVYLNSKL